MGSSDPAMSTASSARAGQECRAWPWPLGARLWRWLRGPQLGVACAAEPQPEAPPRMHAAAAELLPALTHDELWRDLREGVGARLQTALGHARAAAVPGRAAAHSAEPADIALNSLLGACLLELRWIQCAAGSGVLTLRDALDGLHADVAPELAAAGCSLEWRVEAAAADLPLPAKVWLAVLRVAREALDNCARHAQGATRVRLILEVVSGETGRHLRLRVRDDGQTPLERAPGKGVGWGRGLGQVRRCATDMGAQLIIGPEPGVAAPLQARGWVLELVLPLSRQP